MADVGPRPRVVANQRLGLPQFEAVADFIYAFVQNAAGLEFGVAEGVMSPPAWTYEVVGPVRQIRLGAFTMYAARNAGAASNLGPGFPFIFDPSLPEQVQSTVDLSAYSNAGFAIWATVDLVDSTLDNARVWESGYPDGRAVAMLTERLQRVRFTATTDIATPPGGGDTWWNIAVGRLPPSGAPTIVWVGALDFDSAEYFQTALATGQEIIGRYLQQYAFQAGYNPANNDGRSFGVSRVLTLIGMKLLNCISSEYTFDPITMQFTSVNPDASFTGSVPRGLIELDEDLTTAEADIAALEVTQATQTAAINSLTNCRVLWTAQIAANGTPTTAMPFAAQSITRTTTGTFEIDFGSSQPSGLTINNLNAVPQVSIGNASSAQSVTSRWVWSTTTLLTVYIYRDNSDNVALVNEPFSVTLTGIYV